MSARLPVPAAAEVVVLGGGLAGLAATRALLRAGVDVQLLEARGRVGGRVLTLRAPFDDGLYAEAGGEFISASHRVVRDFLRSYGLALNPLGDGPRVFSIGGEIQRGQSPEELSDDTREAAERLERATSDLAGRIPDPRRPWNAPAAAELDARSLAEWLDELRLHPIARTHQDVWTTVDYGVEATHLSLLQYARDERLLLEESDGADRAPGGMDRLPAAMAAELGPRVHLETAAIALARSAGSVTVRFARDGAAGTIVAGYAVVALPLTVLRSLEVQPPFDAARRQAVDGLGYGSVVKVLLQFKRRFWKDAGLSGRTLVDVPTYTTYDATEGQPGRRGILAFYTAGRLATELARLSDAERLARCLSLLELVYPGCSADLERGVSTTWDADRTSLGAYSHFCPGALTRFGPVLARPEGPVHFAGEHTDPWQATMNGALASGVRAADEVLTRRNRRQASTL